MPAPSKVPSWRVASATISMLAEVGVVLTARSAVTRCSRLGPFDFEPSAATRLPPRNSWISLTSTFSRRRRARASRGVSASITPLVVPPPLT
jgi:hypothetical protein